MSEPRSKIPIDIETNINMASIEKVKNILAKIPNSKPIKIALDLTEDLTKSKNDIDKGIKSLKGQITRSLNSLNDGNTSTIGKILNLSELENSISILDKIGKKVKSVRVENGKEIEKPYLDLGKYLSSLNVGNLKIDTSSFDSFRNSILTLKNDLINSLNLDLNVNNNSFKKTINQLLEIIQIIDKINQSVININTNIDNLTILKKLLGNIQEQIISLNGNENTRIKLQFDEGSITNFKNQLVQVQTELTKIKELTSISTPIVSNTKNGNPNANTTNTSNNSILVTFNEKALVESKARLNSIIEDLVKERIIPVTLQLNSTQNLEQKLLSIQEKAKNISIPLKINQQEEITKFNTLIDGIQKKLNNLTGVISKAIISDKAISELDKNPVYISAKLNETSRNKIISDLEDMINKNDGLTIKIKNLDAISTGAISSLKSKIENELKDVALTIIPKSKETSSTNTSTSNNIDNNPKSMSSIISSYSSQLMFYKNLLNTLNLDTNKNAKAIETATNNIEVYKKLLIDTGEAGEETLSYITKLFETSPKIFTVDTNLGSLNEKQQESLFKNYINTISKSNQQISKQNDTSNITSQNNELKNQVQILKDILRLDTEINRANTDIVISKNKGDIWTDYLQNLKNQKQQLSSQLSGVFKSVFDTASQSIDFDKLFNLNELNSKQKSSFKQLYNNFLKKQYLNQQQISKFYENQNNNSNTIINTNNNITDNNKKQNNSFFKNIDKTLKGYDKLVSELNKRNINPLVNVNNNNSQPNQQLPLLEQLNTLYNNINNQLTNYKTKLSSLGTTGNTNIQTQIENLEKLKTTILKDIDAYNKLKETANQQIGISKSIVANEKLTSKYSKLSTDIQKYINQNGKVLNNSTFKEQLNNLLVESTSPDNRNIQNLANLQTRFTNIQTQISKLGLTGRSVGQELDFIFSKIGLKAVFGTMIYQAIAYFKQMLVTVKDVDTSMVTLKRVTSETSSTYNEFLNTASTNAKKLATTITNIIDATSSWSRLGYSLEDAVTLGNLSTMYANVGFIDVDTATKDLVTSMKAFNIASNDAVKIVDAFNEIGNKFAISSADVGSGLTRSASALNVAGNTLNESIAMITGIGEITQDTESAGNALKTLSMRLRGAKADLEDMGEDVDGLSNSTAKMRKDILSLAGVDIMEDESTFKSTYQIMKEISAVWNELSDINQAGLLEKIAGKTRANQISALITNWSQVEKALETANNSSGSATKENAKYVDSIEGKINVVKASAQEFSKTAFSDDFLKSVLDTINSIINKTEKWSELMGALPLLVSAVGGTYGALGKQFGNIGFTPDWILNFTKLNQAKEIISKYSNFDLDELISERNKKINDINNPNKDAYKNLSDNERTKQTNLLKEEIKQINKAKSVLNSSNFNRLRNSKDLVSFNREIRNTSDAIKNLENILGYQGKGLSNNISERVLKYYDGLHMFGINSDGTTSSSIINNNLVKAFDEYNKLLIQKQTNEQKYVEDYNKHIENLKKQNTYLSGYIKQQSGLNEKASVESYKTYLNNLSQSGNYKTTGFAGITNTIIALNEYNKLADTNATKTGIMNKNQKDYLNTMLNLNPVFVNNIQSMNRAKISIQQYAIATTMSKVATVGLRMACAGLNAIVGGVISMAIMTVVSHIWSWITSLNKLSTKMKETLSDTQNNTKTLNNYIDKLKELKKQQDEAVNDGNKKEEASINQELISLQKELINTYGNQVDGINLVNGGLKEQLNTLKQISKEQAKQFLQETNASSDIEKAQKKLFYKDNKKFKLNLSPGEVDNQLLKELINNDTDDVLSINRNNYREILINSTSNSAKDIIEAYQSIYDRISQISKSSGKDLSRSLANIQKQINSLEKDITEYGEINNQFLDSFVTISDYSIDGKSLYQLRSEIEETIIELNDAIGNNDIDKENKLLENLSNIKETLSKENLDTLIEPTSHLKTKGLNNYFASMFDGLGLDEYEQKENAKKLINKIVSDRTGYIDRTLTNSELKIELDKLIENPNYTDNKIASTLETLKSVIDETGISAENLIDVLLDLGKITPDPEDWIPDVTKVSQNIGNPLFDISSELFGLDDITVEKFKDNIDIIQSALDNLKNNGFLSSEDILKINGSNFKSALKYNSENSSYNIDYKKIEQQITAEYNRQLSEISKNRNSLVVAKKETDKEFQKYFMSGYKPEVGDEYLKKYIEAEKEFNDSLETYNTTEKILIQQRDEILKSINNISIQSDVIKNISSEISSMYDVISKLNNGDTLLAEDVGNILSGDYANTLEVDKETNLLTINIEKYKELAQAKINAYKVDTQSALNDLRNEQNLIYDTISYYENNMKNFSASSTTKEYASIQISKLKSKLKEVTSELEKNGILLNELQTLSDGVANYMGGTFEDIVSTTKELETSANTMSGAFKEVKDNGYLSLSTATNLIDSGYATCIVLDKETNQLTLNASAYKDLAKQKINDQIATLQSLKVNKENSAQIQTQIQILQSLRDNLDSVSVGSYGNNQDYWKAEAEQQFAQLEHLHNMNVLDDTSYYNELEKLNDKYYKGKIKYLEEYRKYEEEIYKGQFEVQKELINKEKEALETQKDGWETQQDYWNDQKDALEDQKDYWNDLIDVIDKQIKSINKEKDYWNDQKDLLSEQKDAIQEQIDAIEEKNEEEEKTLKIQEAQLRLQNALNQKPIREFSEETGWNWTTDKNEIKEAQQELDELLKEDEISQLEKQIDELDKQDKEIDKIIKQLDREIDILEDEKEVYNDEIDLINDSIDSIDKEIEAINKQEEILDKQIEALNKQIDDIEKKSNAPNTSHIDELSGNANTINKFTQLSQQEINQLLGLPTDFNTSLVTNIKEPMESLKNSINSTEQILSDLNQKSTSNLFPTNFRNSQTLSVSINEVNTQNASEFIDQLGTILISQLK